MEKKVYGKILSSLEKVLPEKEPVLEIKNGSMFLNEEYHLQLAYYCDSEDMGLFPLSIQVEGALSACTHYYKEHLNPSTVVWRPCDEDYVSTSPCLIPDALLDFDKMSYALPAKQWRAVWVSIKLPEDFQSGVYETSFSLCNSDGETLVKLPFTLEVIGARLPKNPLRLSNWMHYDGIAHQHNVKPFSKAYYKVFESYLKVYVESGFNMLLTPLFTPPLDTEIGYVRTTAQLVGVTVEKDGYTFDFTQLKYFLDFVRARGIEYIEFSHLFTQWGGKACPKIMAKVNGKTKQIFGWETPSDDERYVEFLRAFLKELAAFIDKEGLRGRSYFHLTDEPHEDHLPTYKKCSEVVREYIGDMPIMDALSHYEFYKHGLLDVPVVYTPAYTEFEPHGLKDVMVYNCCIPATEYYSNRFIYSPSYRMRILGFQLYETGVQGYLHWGYNFYNSWRSITLINPWATTDSAGLFPSGDGFMVYPIDGGACTSIRCMMSKESVQDYTAMCLLESFVGREKAVDLLHEWGLKGYNTYERGAVPLTEFREKINQEIKKYL
jgi:hypothetical protein